MENIIATTHINLSSIGEESLTITFRVTEERKYAIDINRYGLTLTEKYARFDESLKDYGTKLKYYLDQLI